MREPQVGGLALPKDVGIGEADTTAIQNHWHTIDRVNAWLASKGMKPAVEPDVACPEVTTEALLAPDIKTYTTVFAAQLRWYNYSVRLLADIRSILLQVRNEMEDIAIKKRTGFREYNKTAAKNEKMTASEMEDDIGMDPRYRALRLEEQEYEQNRIKLDAWVESLDRNLKTVSRQIENRKAESEGGNREGNMGRGGGQGGQNDGRWRGGGR
jgi:hypothetical protein